MFEYMTGCVEYVGPEYIVLDYNGIGFQLYTPNPYAFKKSAERIRIYTYQYVREDLIALYGFMSREERSLFMKLISVTGIGPKGALAILASGNPTQLVQALEEEDEKFLVKFPGVGKKTARQMILDLKGKLVDIVPDAVPSLFSDPIKLEGDKKNELADALEALQVLGYSEREIAGISPELKREPLTTEQYIKKALQLLLQGKR